MAVQAEKSARGLGPPGGSAGPAALLMADRAPGPDFSGVGEAMRPLAELCLSPQAETPFAVALIGGRGAGKSFALARLIERIGRKAAAAQVVIAEVDAAAAPNPSGAIAAAAFAALERDRYTA